MPISETWSCFKYYFHLKFHQPIGMLVLSRWIFSFSILSNVWAHISEYDFLHNFVLKMWLIEPCMILVNIPICNYHVYFYNHVYCMYIPMYIDGDVSEILLTVKPETEL